MGMGYRMRPSSSHCQATPLCFVKALNGRGRGADTPGAPSISPFTTLTSFSSLKAWRRFLAFAASRAAAAASFFALARCSLLAFATLLLLVDAFLLLRNVFSLAILFLPNRFSNSLMYGYTCHVAAPPLALASLFLKLSSPAPRSFAGVICTRIDLSVRFAG
eukprot:s421_g21.t2